MTLKKNRSCVVLTRKKFRVLRRNLTRFTKNRYTAHERSTCVNNGLLFGLALSYDIVYLQSIKRGDSGDLKKSIMEYDSDYHVNLGLVITLCDWRVNYLILF